MANEGNRVGQDGKAPDSIVLNAQSLPEVDVKSREDNETLDEPRTPTRPIDLLYGFIPAIDSLRHYSWGSFRLDLFAGVTVAAVAVPQAMAYAVIAGLPPQYGLYTAIVMTAVGALLDSSRQLINGPTNAICIAMLSALAAVPDELKLQYAFLLAFLMGATQTGITLMRLGDLTRFISHSVIVGFTVGASLLLVMDQFKNLVGIPNPNIADRAARIAITEDRLGAILPVRTTSEGHRLGVVSEKAGALRIAVVLPADPLKASKELERFLTELLQVNPAGVKPLPEESRGESRYLLHGLSVNEVRKKLQTLKWDMEEHFIWRFLHTLSRIGDFNPWTLLIGLGTMALVFVLRWVNERWLTMRWGIRLPEFLLVMALMAAAVWFFALDQGAKPVAVVGSIPRELPTFQTPQFSWTRTRELMASALAIGILGLLEAVAMAKAIAARTGQKLDINQQCLSEGLANLAGSFFQCFPGSGSLTRSNINVQAGAVSQWSGVIAACAVALTVLALAPLAYYIPRASLAGILMISAWRLVDRKQLMYHLRTTRFDAGIVLATALSAIVVSVEFCILIGVFLSFIMFVPRAARLHLAELVITPERVIRERTLKDQACGKILLFNLEGELFFGAAADLEKHLDRIAQRAQNGMRVVVLRLKRVRNPDAVCLDLLDRFMERLHQRKITLVLCGVRADLARVLHTSGLEKRIGPSHIFLERPGVFSSTLDAVRHAYDLLAGDLCAQCPRRGDMSKDVLYYMI